MYYQCDIVEVDQEKGLVSLIKHSLLHKIFGLHAMTRNDNLLKNLNLFFKKEHARLYRIYES